jgi:hypothetical protein
MTLKKALLNVANGYFLEKERVLSLLDYGGWLELTPDERYFLVAYVWGQLDTANLLPFLAANSGARRPITNAPKRIAFLSTKFSSNFVSSQTAYKSIIPYGLMSPSDLFLIQTKSLEEMCPFYSTLEAASYVELHTEGEIVAFLENNNVDMVIDLTGSHWAILRLLRASSIVRVSLFATFGLESNLYDFHLVSWDSMPRFESYKRDLESRVGAFVSTKSVFLIPYNFPLPTMSVASSGNAPILGVFSRPSKWSEACVRSWAAILKRCPKAKLHISFIGINTALCEYIVRVFEKLGIDSARITFFAQTNSTLHFEKLKLIDLYLDSFPQGGGLQIMEVISAGIPAVVMGSEDPIFSPASAIMTRLGCLSSVVRTADEYVNHAVELLESFQASKADWRFELQKTLENYLRVRDVGLLGDHTYRSDIYNSLINLSAAS